MPAAPATPTPTATPRRGSVLPLATDIATALGAPADAHAQAQINALSIDVDRASLATMDAAGASLSALCRRGPWGPSSS